MPENTIVAAGKKQYGLIDAFRIVSAFFIVTIHVHFPGVFGESVIAVARFAVPFFFMTSGFFCYYDDDIIAVKKLVHKIKRITVLFAMSIALYLLYRLAEQLYAGTAAEYFKGLFAPKALAEFLFFNQNKISEHLWFLPALAYVYAVFIVFVKLKINKKVFFLTPVLFFAGIVIKEITGFIDNCPEIMKQGYFCRNWLFIGLPFCLLGYFIRVNEDKCKSLFSNFTLLAAFTLGSAESVLANIFYGSKSVYIGSTAAVIGIFLFAIKNEDALKLPRISMAGKRYSLYIYISHILVREAIAIALRRADKITGFSLSSNILTQALMPFIVFFAALAVSVVYFSLKQRITHEKEVCKKKGI